MSARKMSFPEIVRSYQQPLYWYIRRIVLIHEDSEDILQETFIKAYRHLWMLRSDDALKPWLYKIASNEIRRYFTRQRENVPLESTADMEVVEQDSISPARASEIISSAILQMSPLQREVFILRYYEGLEYDRISQITGASRNTLMVSYHEAKKKIEKEINK